MRDSEEVRNARPVVAGAKKIIVSPTRENIHTEKEQSSFLIFLFLFLIFFILIAGLPPRTVHVSGISKD